VCAAALQTTTGETNLCTAITDVKSLGDPGTYHDDTHKVHADNNRTQTAN